MAAVGRRPLTNGDNNNHTTAKHGLDDLDAALLQTFIAKRVIQLDDALQIFETLVDVTGSRTLMNLMLM